MAHRLPPAGTKSVESEHFAFCQVLPKEKPKMNNSCAERVGACMLRPHFVALPTENESSRGACGGQEHIHIRCFCQEDSGPICRLELPTKPTKTPQYQKIIVIHSPDATSENQQKWAGTQGCHLANMRRREVTLAHPERCSSQKFLEFVDQPFTGSDGCDDPCSTKGSLSVNVGSDRQFVTQPDGAEERCLVRVVAKDCRPRVPDFRRRKPAFSKA